MHLIKEHLYEYIDSFNKTPGTYTRDELYDFGVRHKNLPKGKRSWSELAKYVGYKGNPDSYRKFVLNRQMQEKEINQVTASSNNIEYEDLYKQKTQIRDIYNNYRLSLRNQARVDSFIDNLFEAIRAIKPYPATTIRKSSDIDSAEAVLLVSDLHIGVKCDNFYNTYNKDVALKRLEKLALDVLRYCEINNVKDLHVLNLGDLIQGIIHINARITQELDLIDQITTAAELMSKFLTILDDSDINIYYRSCTDNHSRALADKNVGIEAENFNKLIDSFIKIRLEKSKIKFMNDNIDESLGKFTLANGKKIMFAHGHLENINKCIDAFIGATKEFIDYVCLSHFHCGKEKSYNGSKLIINGSIVGTEQYALSRRLFGPAEQKLLIFDNDNFLDLTINLQ